MESVKIKGVGFESYGVRSVHVHAGQTVRHGDLLLTIASSNDSVEVRAERDGVVMSVLVCSGDRVKSGNEVVRFHGDGHQNYHDRHAVGY